MSLYSKSDIDQEADIKRAELASKGVRGYLADIEIAKLIRNLHRKNRRDRLIPTDLPDVPCTIELSPALTLGLTDKEMAVISEVADVGISNVESVDRKTAQRIVFRVAARLIANGTVVQSNGSSSGSGEEPGGSAGVEEIKVDR